MTKFKRLLGRPAVTAVLFVLAIALLLGSAIGGAMAVLNAQSEFYSSKFELSEIGVALLENDKVVSNGEIMKNVLGGDKNLVPGKGYAEQLAVKNTGEIDEFVRVTVYKYWENADGVKQPETKWDSSLIQLHFVTDNGWHIDSSPLTETIENERTVLYYDTALAPGESSPLFMEAVSIDNEIMEKVEQTYEEKDGLITITTTYLYNGARFRVCAYVDGVQTHNAKDAIKSAWGVDATVSGNTYKVAGGW